MSELRYYHCNYFNLGLCELTGPSPTRSACVGFAHPACLRAVAHMRKIVKPHRKMYVPE